MTPLVSADWLRSQDADPAIRLIDVRWVLGALGAGRAKYHAGHLPSAVHLDIDEDLSDPSRPGPGRHPLPALERFSETMSRQGVGDDTLVVGYDDAGGAHAARLWWLLQYAGHPHARVLDGGVAAWIARGGAITAEVPRFAPRRFTVRPSLAKVVSKRQVVDALERGAVVLDARARERYEGKQEPIDPRPGHIPGARSAPFTENLSGSGCMHDAVTLHARFTSLGAAAPGGRVICHCGSGVTACHTALAMVAAGLPMPELYEGSWSDWSRDESLPAKLGADP
jgi:thiosulfate/3-mercaptopyruvate sulfurtransferase